MTSDPAAVSHLSHCHLCVLLLLLQLLLEKLYVVLRGQWGQRWRAALGRRGEDRPLLQVLTADEQRKTKHNVWMSERTSSVFIPLHKSHVVSLSICDNSWRMMQNKGK